MTPKTIKLIGVKKAKSFGEKSLGVMFQEKFQGMALETRFGIHTFAVKGPIDVLIIDEQNRVVKIKENLKPRRIFLWNPIYSQVIELPEGTIEKKKIKIGSRVSIIR